MNQTLRSTMLRGTMLRPVLAAMLLLTGVHARAQGGCVTGGTGGCTTAPEVDPSLGPGALALLGGAVLLLRARSGAK